MKIKVKMFADSVLVIIALVAALATLTWDLVFCAWALITGATDGIGLAFVHELASYVLNVKLCYMDGSQKLDTTLAVLREKYHGREFASVVADAAESDGMQKSVAAITSSLDQLKRSLTLLITHAGGSSPQDEKYLEFKDLPEDQLDALLNLKVKFTAKLT